MNSANSCTAGSESYCLSVTSFKYRIDVMPVDLSRPAGVKTEPTDTDTFVKNCFGFQPESYALRIAIAANLGVATLRKVSALLACKVAICESTVASVVSYETSLMIALALSPRPARKPIR